MNKAKVCYLDYRENRKTDMNITIYYSKSFRFMFWLGKMFITIGSNILNLRASFTELKNEPDA